MTNELSKPADDCVYCKTESVASTPAPSKAGLYTTLAIGGVAVAFTVAALPFILPAMRKHTLPYVPATDKQISNVFKAVRIYSQQSNLASIMLPQPLSATGAGASNHKVHLVDLGSGDGRIVFEAAKRGYYAEGVELNTMLYLYSRFKMFGNWKGSKEPKYFIPKPVFKRADFWNIDMGKYDLIVVFGVQEMMKDLASKLKAEMKENALIVSCRYPISSYQYVYNLDSELDGVWIYQKSSLNKLIQKEPEKEQKVDDDDDDD